MGVWRIDGSLSHYVDVVVVEKVIYDICSFSWVRVVWKDDDVVLCLVYGT